MRTPLYTIVTMMSLTTALHAEQLTVLGPWLGPDKDSVEAVLSRFSERSGHDVRYVGSDTFEQQIMIDAQAGAAPNIAIFPQPGLAADMAARGLLTPLQEGTSKWVKEHYAAGSSWVDLATFQNAAGDEDLYGFFYRVDVKSLVWYSPENFEDAGYTVPETMEELLALSERIVSEGAAPWCIGLGSGGATGWPATDWVEDMLLRTQPASVYDQWVQNEIAFDAPEITAAIDAFGAFARRDDYVAGGARAVASTDFRDSPKGLFSAPPHCYMHRQASFIPAFFPEGTQIGRDADFFYFPAYESEDLGAPVLGSGTMWAITNDSAAAHELIDFLQDPEAHEVWMQRGSFLTPHKGVDPSQFADAASKRLNDILLSATTFRFDGSDMMPGAIGAGAFWTGMIDYVGGAEASEVAGAIQARWDALK